MSPFTKERIEYLLQIQAGGTASEAEQEEFTRLIEGADDLPALQSYVKEIYDSFQPGMAASEVDWQSMFEKILRTRQEQTPEQARIRKVLAWPRIAAAAVLLGLMGTAAWLLYTRNVQQKMAVTATEAPRRQADIPPGTNKAILTLANGTNILLDSAHTGILTKQGGTSIKKLDGGQLAYTPTDSKTTALLYNTLRTPRGGQYKVILPDGTNVWLNAASSLSYPSGFAGKTREVTLSGEAYFEIAQDSRHPFKVNLSEGQQVVVLGTHFNINAYPDEAVSKTTLLEGAVKVASIKEAIQLQPGQQAQISKTGQITKETPADPGSSIAWKEGRFEFNGNIQDIMRQLARWYDIDVDYAGNITDKSFGGAISRKQNISEVLKFLELTGSIHFKIENRKVTVMK